MSEHPHAYAGSSSDRQSVGDPGHCEDCCSLGHVEAHPDLGCGDVGCDRLHPEPTGDLALEPVAADSAELAQWLAGRASMDPVRATLAYRLRLARRLAGLTTHDATLAAGLGTTTIARWESGDRTPSAVMLSVLARVYGQPLGWFFPDQHVEGEVVDLAAAFGSLSRRDQKTVSMLIKYLLGRGEGDEL